MGTVGMRSRGGACRGHGFGQQATQRRRAASLPAGGAATFKPCCTVALVCLTLCGTNVADIINVPGDFPTIQEAIDAAMDGDEVEVHPGTYFETIDFLGKTITVRSSGGPEVTIIDAQQTGTVVTCNSGEGANTVLDGFTLTGGVGTPSVNGFTDGGAGIPSVNGFTDGGGMYNSNSSPTVTNCTFSGNTADFGGGVYNTNSSPMVTNCTFSGNTANFGGGMCNNSSSPTVAGSTFMANSTPIVVSHAGGAIFSGWGSHATITDSAFHDNEAWHGGALANVGPKSNLTIHNCLMTGNFSDVGGALFNQDAIATLTNCLILGNEVSGDFGVGGGILSLVDSASLVVVNTLMAMNVAEGDGGAISHFFETAGTVIANSTITLNSAGGSGGGVFINSDGQGTVNNSIL